MKRDSKSNARSNRVSGISSGLGHLSVASVVVPFLIDKFDLIMLILGLALAATFYFLSVAFAK